MALLEVNDIHTYYGNIHALKGISLSVEKGEIVTLIGANGAGKTTTLRSISGLLKPRQGTITLEGEDLAKYKAHEVVYKRVAMVPEGRGVFARLTVSENLDMGAFSRTDKQSIQEDLERVFNLFPRMKERRNQVAGWITRGLAKKWGVVTKKDDIRKELLVRADTVSKLPGVNNDRFFN